MFTEWPEWPETASRRSLQLDANVNPHTLPRPSQSPLPPSLRTRPYLISGWCLSSRNITSPWLSCPPTETVTPAAICSRNHSATARSTSTAGVSVPGSLSRQSSRNCLVTSSSAKSWSVSAKTLADGRNPFSITSGQSVTSRYKMPGSSTCCKVWSSERSSRPVKLARNGIM
jgi:hypothetical protein